jgi:serine/threonine protein kinase
MYAVDTVLCRACRATIEDSARFCTSCGLVVTPPPGRLGRGSMVRLDDWGEVLLAEPLGQGGMGVVHRAWLEYSAAGRLAGTPGHPVAVKVLRLELRGSERARELFQREARALERLAHPNIVRFVGLCEGEGQLAIVMEYVQGSPLSHVIHAADKCRTSSEAPCLAPERAWHYFAQLLGALAAVHTLGILHRDVKAANVLIRPDGATKLTDFGIARLPEGGPGGATGGMVAGTGAYMSPEQVRGDPLDPRADLYSAAIVLYEMLTGRTPFDTPERDELMLRTAQLEEAPPPLSEHLAGVPRALDQVMAHALAKDRQHRFGSAIALGEAVRAALGFEPGQAWAAQREFANIAKTISEPLPAADPELIAQAEWLRTAMMTPLGR